MKIAFEKNEKENSGMFSHTELLSNMKANQKQHQGNLNETVASLLKTHYGVETTKICFF